MGHYLVNFAEITFGASALELAEAKVEINGLRYLLDRRRLLMLSWQRRLSTLWMLFAKLER